MTSTILLENVEEKEQAAGVAIAGAFDFEIYKIKQQALKHQKHSYFFYLPDNFLKSNELPSQPPEKHSEKHTNIEKICLMVSRCTK